MASINAAAQVSRTSLFPSPCSAFPKQLHGSKLAVPVPLKFSGRCWSRKTCSAVRSSSGSRPEASPRKQPLTRRSLLAAVILSSQALALGGAYARVDDVEVLTGEHCSRKSLEMLELTAELATELCTTRQAKLPYLWCARMSLLLDKAMDTLWFQLRVLFHGPPFCNAKRRTIMWCHIICHYWLGAPVQLHVGQCLLLLKLVFLKCSHLWGFTC
jgi:hypothetical protein